MRQVTTFALCISLASVANANCVDFNGSFSGTCESIAAGQSNTFPADVTIEFSPNCSKLTITGLFIPRPGINGIMVDTELATYNYQTPMPGLMNVGQVANSAHYNELDNSILIVSTTSLITYSHANPPPPPPLQGRVRTTHQMDIRIFRDMDGNLIANSTDNIFTFLNAGEQGNFTALQNCTLR